MENSLLMTLWCASWLWGCERTRVNFFGRAVRVLGQGDVSVGQLKLGVYAVQQGFWGVRVGPELGAQRASDH